MAKIKRARTMQDIDDGKREALIALMVEHGERARLHETLRAETTNFSLALIGGLSAWSSVVQEHSFVGGLTIIGVSIWGALLGYKHFERHRRHLRVVESFRQTLGIESQQVCARRIELEASEDHKRRFVKKYFLGDQIEQIEFHWLYLAIYLITIVIGMAIML